MREEQVLQLLRQGGYVSGEDICQTLGMSRAGVWKIMDKLRRQGYEITAKTGLGYQLVSAPDVLHGVEIQEGLCKDSLFLNNIVCLEEVGSTNTFVKSLAQNGAPQGTVVAAECQTAGRGRMQRSFHSPAGTGIYMSVLLRPQLPPQALMGLTAVTAVAVCQAIFDTCGLQASIKWPNDIVVDGKKVCGILTELSLEGESGRVDSVVLGLGINVGQTDFPPELEQCAVSLRQLGYEVSRPKLAAAVLNALEPALAALENPETYLAYYREHCANLGRELQLLRLDGTTVTATGEAIDDAFALVVRHQTGALEALQSGEVSVRGIYGA